MDSKEKKKLKNILSSILSKENITFKEIDSIKQDERRNTINNELLRINKIALQWALKNKVLTADELKEEKFITDNKPLSDFIADAGLGALGVGGAAAIYNVVAAPVFLGFGGGLAAVGLGGAVVIAAPVLVTGLFIYGKAYYKNQKEVEELIKYFNKEKEKIQNFYFSKINNLQSYKKFDHIEKKNIKPMNQNKKILKPKISIQEDTPSPKKPVKKETKPKIKEIEKDPDYDRCVIRYDDKLKACSIKHEDNVIDKKNGLHGKTFKSFVHKIPSIIGHDIFNISQIEVVFIGTKTDLLELKQACKAFKESDNIDIEISFRDISKKT